MSALVVLFMSCSFRFVKHKFRVRDSYREVMANYSQVSFNFISSFLVFIKQNVKH
ncbi:hypothetical protein PALB_21610 [Pseudoalteromonas luteoviolacea B = ATCC 29581]|nr:hypothetical protein PALB_21610 [Pseudoalteromonas luteoviolacea B = ATCC 29581]